MAEMIAEAPEAADAALVARLRTGDEAAFAEVVLAWTPAMLHVARSLVASDASAEEVVQETWAGVAAPWKSAAAPGVGGLASRRGGDGVTEPLEPPVHLPCVHAVELLTDYLEGAPDAETVRRVEFHLELCPPCATYLEQLRETTEALRRLTPPPVPDGLAARLAATFADFPR